jgi:hypothetical protein
MGFTSAYCALFLTFACHSVGATNTTSFHNRSLRDTVGTMPCQFQAGEYACPLNSLYCCPVRELRSIIEPHRFALLREGKSASDRIRYFACPLQPFAATACCDIASSKCGFAYMCAGLCTNTRCSCKTDQNCQDGQTYDVDGPLTNCCLGQCQSSKCPIPSLGPTSIPGSAENVGAIVGIAVALLIVVAALIGGCVYCCCCRKNSATEANTVVLVPASESTQLLSKQ